MSDAEKDKDVTCFAVDGVVAEMVIEVEENQKLGSDDLPNSPLKDNQCDKKNNSANESNDGVVEKDEENKIVELDTQKENKNNTIEVTETKDKSEEHIEDKKSEGKNYSIAISEENKYDENSENIGDKKSEEINEKPGNKKSRVIIDQNIKDNKSSELNQYNTKNNQSSKRKRKLDEPTMYGNENDIKETDIPRYPELKKRKIEMDSKEKEDRKEILKETVKKKSIQNEAQNVNDFESPKESEKTNLSRSLRNRKSDAESESSATKQNVLRKLPFRKNKDAPDVPDLKPKVFWWNGVGEGKGCKLGDIPQIRSRIQKAKSIRALYRVLFFQWPTNGQDIVGEILQFNGFPFDRASYEYTKRQSLMKIMLDKTIFHMCELLDIRKGDKQSNITNILDFLLRPCAKIDPATDLSWQPVVLLERIAIDDTFLDQSSTNVKLRKGRSFSSSQILKEKDVKSPVATPTRSTRSSGTKKIELVIHPDPERTLDKIKQDIKSNKVTPKESNRSGEKPIGKSTVKESASIIKDSKVTATPGVKKTTPASGTTKPKTSFPAKVDKIKTVLKDSKEKIVPLKKDSKTSPKGSQSKTEDIKNIVSNKTNKKKKFNKKRKKINVTSSKKVPEKTETSNAESKEDSDEYEIEMTIDSGPDIDEDIEMENADTKKPDFETVETAQEKSKTITVEMPEVKQKAIVSTVNLSDSSETESAEETKLITSSKRSSKTPMKRKGKALRQFPKISDSIQNANFSALQRLHILLFGASDKAENLKSNILSFGGFPFLEGSDEWKQKHFLLSLLAQTNLREYLNLLCIPYAHDDQPTMINKLMKFLAVPSEELLDNNNTIQTIETEVVSSVLVDKSSPVTPIAKGKVEVKKKVKKKGEKKVSKRPRKILMSEEEARRLEANFAREQRAIARDRKFISYPPIAQKLPQTVNAATLNMHTYAPQSKIPGKQPISDPDQLNALLQTVYKRRALKDAGAIVSTPNKGQKTKLGDIENIKFLIVTSNINDLDILHRLIFMLEASKSRIRKNILDFDGFGFNEDSPKYKHRMDYLNSLGYEASKRISFLLGLCPLNTDLPQKDLNELIMYFLMSPCKTKQTVPITQMPSDEPHIIVKSTVPLENPIYIKNAASLSARSEISRTSSDEITVQHSTPLSKTGTQKAKKTFPSSSKISPIKKVLLPPSQTPVLGLASFGNKPQKMTLLNSIPAVPSFSLPKTTVSNSVNNVTLLNTGGLILNAPKSPINSLVKVPVSPGKIKILNQGPQAAVADPAAAKTPLSLPNVPVSLSNIPISLSNIPGQVLHNQILIPQIPDKNSIQPSPIQTLLPGSKMLVKSPAGSASSLQEFIVQQQTPDGQQKIFKLIRLPPSHPLVSNAVNKPPIQQTVSSPQLQQQVLLTTNSPLPGGIPPGLVIMKNNTALPQLQNLQILPSAPVKILPGSAGSNSLPSVVSSLQSEPTHPQAGEIVTPNDKESVTASANTSLNDSMEVLSSSDDSPPTDDDLFSSIQEIILSSNFEDITLRNVIERVAAQYPNHDLTHRHNFMKECVKKIIIGT